MPSMSSFWAAIPSRLMRRALVMVAGFFVASMV
jgi:hypothetical protein